MCFSLRNKFNLKSHECCWCRNETFKCSKTYLSLPRRLWGMKPIFWISTLTFFFLAFSLVPFRAAASTGVVWRNCTGWIASGLMAKCRSELMHEIMLTNQNWIYGFNSIFLSMFEGKSIFLLMVMTFPTAKILYFDGTRCCSFFFRTSVFSAAEQFFTSRFEFALHGMKIRQTRIYRRSGVKVKFVVQFEILQVFV